MLRATGMASQCAAHAGPRSGVWCAPEVGRSTPASLDGGNGCTAIQHLHQRFHLVQRVARLSTHHLRSSQVQKARAGGLL